MVVEGVTGVKQAAVVSGAKLVGSGVRVAGARLCDPWQQEPSERAEPIQDPHKRWKFIFVNTFFYGGVDFLGNIWSCVSSLMNLSRCHWQPSVTERQYERTFTFFCLCFSLLLSFPCVQCLLVLPHQLELFFTCAWIRSRIVPVNLFFCYCYLSRGQVSRTGKIGILTINKWMNTLNC